MPESWKESIIIPIFKKGDKQNCNNYRGISLLATSYKVFSNVLLDRLTPHAEQILGDHQCGFRNNRSTTDQIFTIRQLLEKNWEFKKPVYQLFIDFQKAYDSIIREKMFEILESFKIPKKLIQMVKVCLHESKGRVKVGNSLSDPFDIKCGLKQGDALSPLLFNLTLEYAVKKVEESGAGLQFNGKTIQLLTYADDIDLLSDDREALIKKLRNNNGRSRKMRATNKRRKNKIHGYH